MQLSPNFSLAEMTKTSQPFDNVPNAVEIANLKRWCENIGEKVRAHYGRPVHVNSGFRSKRVNDAVGSHDTSQHRLGEAGDIEVPGVSNVELATWIRDNLAFDQLILEAYHHGNPSSGWVHVSYREGRSRKGGALGARSVLTMTMGAHGPVYSAGIHA
jgi:zinc D-Ala-D-Ala carboxypeptidase